TAIQPSFNGMGNGLSLFVPKSPKPMGKAKLGRHVSKVSPKQSNWCSTTSASRPARLPHGGRSKPRSWSDEAPRVASAFARARLPFEREGSDHSLWKNPETGEVQAVPRHSEIGKYLSRKICRDLSVPQASRSVNSSLDLH